MHEDADPKLPSDDFGTGQPGNTQRSGVDDSPSTVTTGMRDEGRLDNLSIEFELTPPREDENDKYIDPQTGAHFRYDDICERLKVAAA